MEEQKFFFFGCWNYDNCSGTRLDYRKAVIDSVLENITDYKFGIIAGDNVYPQKINSKKQYLKKTIDYGFSLLEKLNSKLYGVIGNHELDKPNLLPAQLEKQFFYLPSNNYATIINDFLKIIVIDTNIFNDETDLIKNYSKFKEPIITIENLLLWLENELQFPGWKIVVGHQPIFGYKHKKKDATMTLKIDLLHSNYHRLLDILSSYDKVVYMCADIHQFQAWNIPWNGKNIPMIIAGTGGAIPDQIYKKALLNISPRIKDLKPLIHQNAYGYCSVTVTENEFTCEYIPLQCEINSKKPLYNDYVKVAYNNALTILEQRFSNPINCRAETIITEQCN